MLQIATCEPFCNKIHGGNNTENFIVIYSYDPYDFYTNTWVCELKFYMKKLRASINSNEIVHENIRNYNKVLSKYNNIQLVEIITDSQNRELCILHTYKLNIFKRIWKNKHNLH
jgi:hypothetical protein